jgi:hypothetical protein
LSWWAAAGFGLGIVDFAVLLANALAILPRSVIATVVNALMTIPGQARRTVAGLRLGIIVLAIVLADAAILAIIPARIRATVVGIGASKEVVFSIPSLDIMDVVWIWESRDRAQREQSGHKDLLQQHDGQLPASKDNGGDLKRLTRYSLFGS